MGGRRVENFRPILAEPVDKFRRLLGRRIRQTQNRDIHPRQQLALGFVILALLRRNADEFDVAPAGEFLADFESRRTPLAVYENFRDHCSRPSRAAYTRARFNARICKYRCTIVAAAIAVTSAWSKGGDTSTTSMPRQSSSRACQIAASARAVVKPPATGVPVPGA